METKPRILIVEDEILIAFSLKIELSREGYTVCGIAAGGEEAISMAMDLHPDVILMDVGLKGALDGFAVADLLHQKADIPIIFLSGYMDETNKDAAARHHALACLSKPVSITQLITALAKISKNF